MDGNVPDLATYAFGGVGVSALLFGVLRSMWRKASTEILDTKADWAKGDIIGDLRAEIDRLQVIIEKMQERIEVLEGKVTKLNDRLVSVRSHALVAFSIVQTNCHECPYAKQLKDALTQIIRED